MSSATADPGITIPDRDLKKGHPMLQERWPVLEAFLRDEHGLKCRVIEVYRPELRQQWLYGAGRTQGQLLGLGIRGEFARPTEPKVTNARSARQSAHGWTEAGVPAAAALDVAPVGADNRPWTKDDPWDEFVRLIALHGPGIGLVHFHSPGKAVWDRPHLQLVEWSDRTHRVA